MDLSQEVLISTVAPISSVNKDEEIEVDRKANAKA
jgi:hypothetical protein